MENGRKTVFLLVTDGVANGYRLPGLTQWLWTRAGQEQMLFNVLGE